MNFDGTLVGNVYAQPLYIEGGPNGPLIIAVTESNNVYALNAATGTVIWVRNLGRPVTSGLPGGNINPVGITGTPVVDLASRRLFFDALVDERTKQHFIYSLDVDTGARTSGWPVDVNATATYNGITFNSLVQEQRGGLALVNGIVYVAYSGYAGDCGSYHGWVVGVDINDPSSVAAWVATAIGGGIGDMAVLLAPTCLWSPVTRSTQVVTGWAVRQLSDCKPALGGRANRPITGHLLIGWISIIPTAIWAVSATVIDVPGATPSQLVLALGKDGNAYLVVRNNLGGITAPVAPSERLCRR